VERSQISSVVRLLYLIYRISYDPYPHCKLSLPSMLCQKAVLIVVWRLGVIILMLLIQTQDNYSLQQQILFLTLGFFGYHVSSLILQMTFDLWLNMITHSGALPNIRCSKIQVWLSSLDPFWRSCNHGSYPYGIPLQARVVSVLFFS